MQASGFELARSSAAKALLLVAPAAALACSSETPERPPLVRCDSASQTGCLADQGISGRSGAGSRDAGATDSGDTAVERELSGTLVFIDSEVFEPQGVPFRERARVFAEAAEGGFIEDTVTGGELALQDVIAEPELWAGVIPETPVDALPTWSRVVNDPTEPATLGLVRESMLDGIYSVLPLPVLRASGFAQLVIRFIDAGTGASLSGVQLVAPQAETVIYDAGLTFSNDATATGVDGIALAANLEAVSWPGSLQSFALAGAASGSVQALLARDAVTVVTIGLE